MKEHVAVAEREKVHKSGEIKVNKRKKKAYSTNQTLGILINGSIIRKLQFILQHSNIHIRMIVSPKRRLYNRKTKQTKKKSSAQKNLDQNEVSKLTIPVNIS